ncbi:MAG: LysR family transcriptional regulator [Acidovorax sp.]|nr:LysR family transcriptional regulator [Acidovorax sp.]
MGCSACSSSDWNHGLARRIPPLNPLHTFEVVARTGSLTVAAAQLHVTQSAVSRQIATLEQYFGVELFKRERQGVSLTEVGQRYAAQVVPAFAAIASATEMLWHKPDEAVLRVGTYSTFSAKWLIPRLPQFLARHPGKDVRIHRLVPAVNFDRDPVDLAIQLAGDEVLRQSGLRADRIFPEYLEPVCAPVLLQRLAASGQPLNALLGQRLLVSKYHARDWDDWLHTHGLEADAATAERMEFNASMLTWQAAVHGMGVAIGQWPLLQQEVSDGALVQPFGLPLKTARSYWLLRPQGQRSSPLVKAFRQWLLQEAAKEPLPGS